MIFDREDLNKKIKIISQDAWRVEMNTTMNTMMEYIVKNAMDVFLDKLEDKLNEMEGDIQRLCEFSSSLSELVRTALEDKETEDVSHNGIKTDAKRYQKASAKKNGHGKGAEGESISGA